MQTVYAIYLTAGLLGLVFGSYAGATVWRLRAKQLVDERRALDELKQKTASADNISTDDKELLAYLRSVEKKSASERIRLKPLINVKTKDDRSRCLHCHHVLQWYDLIPLASWLRTRGRCRYCRKPIGLFEPLMEIGTAGAFLLFTHAWLSSYGIQPVGLAYLALWLAALIMLIILFAYDLKWFQLPDKVMFPLIALSAIIFLFSLKAFPGDTLSDVLSMFASIAILAGLYLVLWLASKGRWVGFGDVKLGVALGLLLLDWRLAFLTLFLANLIGTLIVIPGMLAGKLSRKSQVPFGPLLIIGFFISLLYGHAIIGGYVDFTVWLSSAMLML